MAEQTTIRHYQLQGKLGHGGMGQVFLAHDPRFPRDVALKLLHTDLAQNHALRQRFQREASTIAALEHHAIVPVYDFGEHEGQLFLVMRQMRGGSLRDKLTAGSLSPQSIQTILARIASALDKAHEHGIIHRDLKPANILFDDEDQAYLSDFGIVKQTNAETLTSTKGVIGTPQYMSPEQAMGESAIDARSDIYSLAILAYEMLSGAPPFAGDTVVSVLMKHVSQPVPSLAAARPDLPPAVDAVLQRALAKAPADRYASAGEFVAAFNAAMKGQATRYAPSPPVATPQSKKRPTWLVAVAAGSILLIVACAAAVAAMRPWQGLAAAPNATPATSADRVAIVSSAEETSTPTPTVVLTDTPTATATATAEEPSPTPGATATGTPTPTPQAAPSLPSVITGADGLEMRLVPAGEFLMGSTEQGVQAAMRFCRDSAANDPCGLGEFNIEQPERAVYLDAYYMDVTEVTNAHYRACVSAGNCAVPDNQQYYGSARYDDYPVVHVTWYSAFNYCQAAGKRLPTEAEWEKAARGTDARLFPWGQQWDPTRANTEERGGDRLQAVGQYPSGASPYGILDLSGSVWEWVNDWYDPAYYRHAPDRNPQGPAAGSDKILRGGSFSNHVHYARATNRGFVPPNTASVYRGFRCVLSASAP